MDKRTILAVVLSLAVLLVYQFFFVKPPEPQKAAAPQQSADQVKNNKTPSSTPAATNGIAKPALKAVAVKPETPARDIKVETPHYTAVFSTRGGALKSLKLKNYYQDCYECTDDIYPRLKGFFTGTKESVKPKTKDFVELVDVRDGMPRCCLRSRTFESVRPSRRASSPSGAVPSSASSVGGQGRGGRDFSPPGRRMPSRLRRCWTAILLIPRSIATCSSGRSLSTLSSAGVQWCRCGSKMGMPRAARRVFTVAVLRRNRRASRWSDIVPSSSSSSRLQGCRCG